MSNEEMIFQVVDDFENAWNHADSKVAASFFTNDAMRVGAFGDVQHGIDEIETAYKKLLEQTMPGATVKQEKGNVRMLTDHFAIWQGGLQIILPNENILKGHVVQIMKKENDKWLILEAHPKFFPSRP